MRNWLKASRVLCATIAIAASFGLPALAQQGLDAPPSLTPQVLLSEQATQILEQAIAGELTEDLALRFRPFFFPSFQGGTLCMMGIRIGKDGLMFGVDPFADAAADPGAAPSEVANLELFGALLREGVEVRRVGTTFQVAKDGGDSSFSGTYSFGDTLEPGSYEMVWGVRSSTGGKAGTRKDNFEVPDFMTAGLTTSSVLLATGTRQASGSFQPNTVYEGIRVLTVLFSDGLDRVIPASTPEVELTFIVIGAQMDATTQAFNLELTYRIVDDQDQGVWRAAPQKLNRMTVGQPIPFSQIQGLTPGSKYRFQIGVKDLVSGSESTTEIPFEVSS